MSRYVSLTVQETSEIPVDSHYFHGDKQVKSSHVLLLFELQENKLGHLVILQTWMIYQLKFIKSPIRNWDSVKGVWMLVQAASYSPCKALKYRH